MTLIWANQSRCFPKTKETVFKKRRMNLLKNSWLNSLKKERKSNSSMKWKVQVSKSSQDKKMGKEMRMRWREMIKISKWTIFEISPGSQIRRV